MIGASGQVALLGFPQANLAVGKLRPVLVLARVPGRHDDWLVCILSSQMHQAIEGSPARVSQIRSRLAKWLASN